MQIDFRPIHFSDIPMILEIYNHYIQYSTVTFRTEILHKNDIPNILPVSHKKYRSFVISKDSGDVGFCAISRFRNKEAYDRTAEVFVYLKPDWLGKGIGNKTLGFLERTALELGISVLIAYITAENIQSVKAFEKAGYNKAAHLKNVGEKFNRILDVVIYQKELNHPGQ